jgi:putative endonuclease
MAAWLYIVTNRPNGTLYIGVTTDIATRAWQHKTGGYNATQTNTGLDIETHIRVRP